MFNLKDFVHALMLKPLAGNSLFDFVVVKELAVLIKELGSENVYGTI